MIVLIIYLVGFEMTFVWYGIGELLDRFRGRRDPEYRKKIDDDMRQYIEPSNRNILALLLLTSLLWPLMMVADWAGWKKEK